MLWGDTVYLILCPDSGLLVSFCSLVIVCLSLPTNCHTGGSWKYLSASWVNECTHSFFVFVKSLYCAVIRKSTKTFFFFFCILKRSCSVSFVNSVNNHPEGIVYQLGFGVGRVLYALLRQDCVWSVRFLGCLFVFFSVTVLWIRCMYSIYVTLADCWVQLSPVIRVESQAWSQPELSLLIWLMPAQFLQLLRYCCYNNHQSLEYCY